MQGGNHSFRTLLLRCIDSTLCRCGWDEINFHANAGGYALFIIRLLAVKTLIVCLTHAKLGVSVKAQAVGSLDVSDSKSNKLVIKQLIPANRVAVNAIAMHNGSQ